MRQDLLGRKRAGAILFAQICGADLLGEREREKRERALLSAQACVPPIVATDTRVLVLHRAKPMTKFKTRASLAPIGGCARVLRPPSSSSVPLRPLLSSKPYLPPPPRRWPGGAARGCPARGAGSGSRIP
eukprot:15449809-Alexandrium_andersonii.AAC.1